MCLPAPPDPLLAHCPSGVREICASASSTLPGEGICEFSSKVLSYELIMAVSINLPGHGRQRGADLSDNIMGCRLHEPGGIKGSTGAGDKVPRRMHNIDVQPNSVMVKPGLTEIDII